MTTPPPAGPTAERDTRPRFDGGARAQEDEDRCAPLVAFIERVIAYSNDPRLVREADVVLERHRKREGG